METQTNAIKYGLTKGQSFLEEEISGKWELKAILSNNLPDKSDGFSVHMISAYPDPFTGKQRVLVDEDGNMTLGYEVSKVLTILNPDENKKDRNVINFLLGHPQVSVQGVELSFETKKTKKSNPKYILIALDKQNLKVLEDDDQIDMVIAKLISKGRNELSLEKIRAILAVLNLNYINKRHYGNASTEKQILISSLKSFVRQSIENAKRVNGIIEDIENAKYILLIKEMIRFGLMQNNFGSFKYRGEAIALDFEGVVSWLKANPELNAEIQRECIRLQEQEQNVV